MGVRPADPDELDALATIWLDGWREAHAHLMPADLAALRTFASFRDRLASRLAAIRVAGPRGAPIGFCVLEDDELYQLYVSAPVRGTGVAEALLADGEARLAAGGVVTAWLSCAIGNDRAARFYAKHGWHLARTAHVDVETSAGPYPLELWVYEKTVAGASDERGGASV